MSEQQTREILELQKDNHDRLLKLGYADDLSAAKLSCHLAESAVLGKAFKETTLPLFLTIDRDNLRRFHNWRSL